MYVVYRYLSLTITCMHFLNTCLREILQNINVGKVFLPPANEVCEGYVFTGVCLSTGGVHGRGCAWPGACVIGGACVVGACMVVGGMHGRGHVWQGSCVAGGMCGRGQAWQGGMPSQ